ncbi:MAG: multiubiquitin domain-containing protein [Nitrososphaerota archaeon]|nr:multiubiquitin domain-containing protein [Nitrososphaerota archaeon]
MPDEKAHVEIIVNGRLKAWDKEMISYGEVVDVAFPPPHKPTEIFTVQYSHGPKQNPQGTMVEGQSVEVKSGMRFDVTRTDKS